MNNNKHFHFFHSKSIFVISLALAFFSGIFFGNIKQEKAKGNLFGQDTVLDEDYFRYYNMFRQTYKILQDEYVDPEKTGSKTLLSGAIKGMLKSTEDPYTDFLTPEIAAEFAENINATFYGVGIRIEMRNNWITVVAPIKGTPAARAELQAGDQIISIDGESTEGFTSLEAVSKIRGKLGTSVELTIARPRVLQPFTVTLKRDKIDVDTVEYAMIPKEDKNIAYIKIIEFGNPTEREFEKGLKTILAKKPDGLVIDVRNNPGGLLTSVAKISDMLVNEGLIVYTRGRIESENYEFRASKRNTLVNDNIPITILANQGSASASEILIGSLKDTGRGVVVGKTTFGKGCVQKTQPLADGSILKYTIAKYYTPAGNTIAKTGIKPDIEVGMWYDELSDIQKTSVIQLQMTNYIPDFLQTYNDPTLEQIDELFETVTKEGYTIPRDVLNNMVFQRKNIASDEVYNLDIDTQLQKALSVTLEPRENTNYTYFHTPKTMEELQEIEKKTLEEAKKDLKNK